MFGNTTPIYFASARRMLIAFKTIFNDIHIIRPDKDGNTVQEVRVPFEYGSKSHWFRKMQERERKLRDGAGANLTLPRMSFVMDAMQYDSSRKLNTMNYSSNELAEDMKGKQLGPVPYNLNVRMSAWANNLEDLLMIVEQILPLFSPQVNIRIREVDNLNIWNDVDIVLQSVDFDDNYEQGLETNRIVTCDFQFILKGQIYPAIRNKNLIHKTFTDFKNAHLDPATPLSSVNVEANQATPPDYDQENSEVEIIDNSRGDNNV